MSSLPIIPQTDPTANDLPLPLVVAKRWNFPLAHMETETSTLYALQDWMRGITGEDDTRHLMAKFKKNRRRTADVEFSSTSALQSF